MYKILQNIRKYTFFVRKTFTSWKRSTISDEDFYFHLFETMCPRKWCLLRYLQCNGHKTIVEYDLETIMCIYQTSLSTRLWLYIIWKAASGIYEYIWMAPPLSALYVKAFRQIWCVFNVVLFYAEFLRKSWRSDNWNLIVVMVFPVISLESWCVIWSRLVV